MWRNAWAELIPFRDYDVEIRNIICSTNVIESLNAYGRPAGPQQFPAEQTAITCFYLVTGSSGLPAAAGHAGSHGGRRR